jgi:hypothetical protein
LHSSGDCPIVTLARRFSKELDVKNDKEKSSTTSRGKNSSYLLDVGPGHGMEFEGLPWTLVHVSRTARNIRGEGIALRFGQPADGWRWVSFYLLRETEIHFDVTILPRPGDLKLLGAALSKLSRG